ncbi:MAG: sigma-70 factor domain-containing protein, partial [Alphaproteobacteria bacterium]|nr:sigma-70 factor domain-containing protein [Alphaproteobacteria bacterium]
MSDEALDLFDHPRVRKLVQLAQEQGYMTYNEINDAFDEEEIPASFIEELLIYLEDAGVKLIDAKFDPDIEEEEEEIVPAPAALNILDSFADAVDEEDAVEVVDVIATEEARTDDPVRLYLREMGSVSLLSREGEVELAKRIEEGKALMIKSLFLSPLTFDAIREWYEFLQKGDLLLRDVIALESYREPEQNFEEEADDVDADSEVEDDSKPVEEGVETPDSEEAEEATADNETSIAELEESLLP